MCLSEQCTVQIPLPRKGTETKLQSGACAVDIGSNSITPQGDGNNLLCCLSAAAKNRSNSITPQGDGDEEKDEIRRRKDEFKHGKTPMTFS